jgi:hypothetical protein
MKKQLLIVLAGMLFAVGSAYAQSSRLVADIPFDFIVGNKVFPSGQYEIKSIGVNGSSVQLQNMESRRSVFMTPSYCASAQAQDESKLVFNMYGNHFYLSQIWTEGYDQGRELSKSSREREEAQLHEGHHVVILASLFRAR